MNINCLKCSTRMVQHETKFICLLCENEIEVEDWVELADTGSKLIE